MVLGGYSCDLLEISIDRHLHTNYIRFSGASKKVIAECFEDYIQLRETMSAQNIHGDIIEIWHRLV